MDRLWSVRSHLFFIFFAFFLAGVAEAQVWVEQGPGPNTQGQVEGITDRKVVGAINAVAVHPTDANTIYVGAVNGGIWKTTNAATAADPSWVEQLGLNRSLSIGALAFDPTDATNLTLMAGSGRFGSFNQFGGARAGVWRTTDGTNWTLIDGGIAGLNISGVAPRGATLVVAADTADTFANRGVWRSTNTGTMWTKISGDGASGLPNGSSYDLASDPSDPARLFTNSGTAAGSFGIYRSTNTGETWSKVSDVAIDALLTTNTINVQISVGTSNNVYVAIANRLNAFTTQARLVGLFRSGDGGGSWTPLDLPATTELGVVHGIHPGAQGDTHLSLAADRTNANVVYIGGDRQPYQDEGSTDLCDPCFPNSLNAMDFSGRLFRVDASLAAGSQASAITHVNTAGNSSPHADSRGMAIDPNNDLIEVDDGGVYRRTDPLLNTGNWESVIGNLRTTELHSIGWDSRSKIGIGGAQDTGVPEQSTSGGQRWRSAEVADGGDVAVDSISTPDVSVRYGSFQFLGNLRRRTVDTANLVTLDETLLPFTVVGGGAVPNAQFYTPIKVNNADGTRLLFGCANGLYESLDQGDTVRAIAPAVIVNATGNVANTWGADALAYGATGNEDVIYAGAGDDVFIRTAAAPGAPVLSAAYPGNGTGRPVIDIAIHRANPLTAFVIDPTNVYFTDDAGVGWDNITGNLGTLTPGRFRSIEFSTSNGTGRVIVGTDNGIFSAIGPAFNVWSVLGTGLPRAPVFDLAYDQTDETLAAGLMGRGLWTINLSERDPVDVALVLDLSGSMLSPACSGCDTRLQVLKDSVELFVQLWTLFAIEDDRLALNYFRTSINEFTVTGNPLFPVAANAAALIADVQAQTTVSTNLTAMGGGLQTAINRLADSARPRNVILFTDGMQNVNPMVNTTTFAIADEPGRPASGVAATTPATDLGTAGRKVNTIGVGATPAFVELLTDIAAETGGLTKQTTAPDDDLRRFYVEELIDALRTFSPQLIGYRYGALGAGGASEEFTTNGSARRVALKVSWKRGSELNFTVEKDGVPVMRAGRFVNGPFYKIFVIDVPTSFQGQPITAAGQWRVSITGKAGARYEAAAIVDEAELKYDFSISGSNHVAGSPLLLKARLTFAGQPVGDADVTARVLVPKQGLGTLLATQKTPANLHAFPYEPAATDAQRKYQLLLGSESFQARLEPDERQVNLLHIGAGNYAADFNDTAFSGPYTAIFHVRGSRADVGTYERTESRSVTVRFGLPVLDRSDLRIVGLGRGFGDRRYELRVRPVDSQGNYLGPDYGHRVQVFVDGVLLAEPPRDLLDGSYAFPFPLPTGTSNPNVKVTVLDKPLYDGPLRDIPTAGGGRVALSAHLGATIPGSGFAANADNGFLAELDLEFRATPAFSIEGVAGLYDFGSAGALAGLTVYAKKYVPAAGSWRWYGAIGPGVFRPERGDTELGASLAAGLNYAIAARTEFDAGAVYTHVFGPDVGWLGLRVGVKVTF